MKTLLAALLLIAGCLPVAGAASLAEVQVIDRTTGQTLETWRHRGRLYVAGTPGNRYAVNLRNRGDGRVLAVISVDGVNAISGETANASQSGYVLAPGQAAEIAGWRKNMDEVAAFYFTRIADSYAARFGADAARFHLLMTAASSIPRARASSGHPTAAMPRSQARP